MTVNRTDAAPPDLVARCQAGDVDAFAELYALHSARIFSLAARMAGSPETGEDLLQEIFLQAYRKIGGFKGDAAVGTWLYRLALNHCLDFVRSHQARMDKSTDPLEPESHRAAPAASPESPVDRLDRERAKQQLPAGCREVFVLHDVEGYE